MADAEKKPARKRAPKVLKVSDAGAVSETKPKTTRKPTAEKKAPKEQKLEDKLTKDQVTKKVEESKQLSNLIKELGDKNTPKTDAQASKLAKDTIKLVTEAQRSGSLAFKRESTKALVQIRNAIDKSNFAKDATKEKLLLDIDSVVLDTKNVTMYMTSVAKAQVDIIKANGKAEAKQIKQNAMNSARVTRNEAKAEAKRLAAEVALSNSTATEKAANELKLQRAEQALRIRKMRSELQDRAKKQKEDEALRDAQHQHQVEEDKRKVKEMGAERIQKLKKIKQDLMDRKLKRDQENKESKLLLRRKEADMILDYRNRKKEAAERIEMLHQEIKESHKSKSNSKRDGAANGFLQKVGAGINDANPLLELAVTLGKGLKDTAGMLMSKREDKQRRIDPAESRERLERISGPRTRLPTRGGPTPRPAGGPTPPAGPRAGGVPPSSGGVGEGGGGGILSGLMGLVNGIMPFLSSIGRIAKMVLPIAAKAIKLIPGVGIFATAVMGIFDFIDGFNSAGKMFDTLDPSMMQKIFGGLTSVVSGLLSIIDHVAGWFGVELDLAGFYKDSAAKVYNMVSSFGEKFVQGAKDLMNAMLVPYRFMAAKIADALVMLPFMNESDASIKTLRAFGSGGNPAPTNISNDKPQVAAAVAQKTTQVAALTESAKSAPVGNTTAVVDNSVKTSSTTIVTQKMTTRTNEPVKGGYGTLGM
jgi:hypothetical protein